MNTAASPAAELRAVTHIADDGSAIRDLSVAFAAGSLHLMRDAAASSGAAILRVLGLLDPPASGEVLLCGTATRHLDEATRTSLRNRHCGFVFAAPFLLREFGVAENVAMPLFKISQVGPEEARRRTDAMLAYVGLSVDPACKIGDLPLPDQFRVALARALVNEPALLLVENVEAALTGSDLHDFLSTIRRATRDFGIAAVALTAGALAPEPLDRVIELADGSIRHDSIPSTPP